MPLTLLTDELLLENDDILLINSYEFLASFP